MDPLISPVEPDRAAHSRCKLKSALRLIGERDVRVPERAYPMMPSRLARALQMGNSISTLLFSGGKRRTLVSGQGLAYVSGELEYFNDHIFFRSLRFVARKQPFFVLSGDAVASIASVIGCDAVPAPRIRLSSQCVVIITANYKGLPVVWRVAACDEARAEVLRQINGLRIAACDQRLREFAPRFVSHSTGAIDVSTSAETKVPGVPMEFSWQRVDAVRELWLSGKPVVTGLSRPNLCAELTHVCDALPAYRDSLCILRESLVNWHSRSRMPGEIAHGDLWLGNVLFTGNTVTGIVDWEWAQTDGLRLLDLLHLLLISHSVFRNTSVAHCFRQFWADEIEDPALKDRVQKLRVHFGLDKDDLKFAALLLWFDYLCQRAIRRRMPSLAWTEDMIPRTTPVIRNWIRGRKRGTSETAA